MEGALQPFTRYMIDLAEGKLDKFFDPTELEPWRTHLGVTLPNGPMLILHDLGNHPDDARLTGIFKSETVFVLFKSFLWWMTNKCVAIYMPSLVPERLDFASRDSATNGDFIFHAEVPQRTERLDPWTSSLRLKY
jgi:hypothetical protein